MKSTNPWIPVLLFSCALAMTAQAAEPPLAFKPGSGITARVEHADSEHISLRLMPANKLQQLDVGETDPDGHYRFEVQDYNFDGYQDLAIVALQGMVNDGYRIYLYEPAQQQFTLLDIPAGSDLPSGNCEGLWNVSAKSQERILYSSCRGGPAWYTDAYRYGANGHIYLYQATQDIGEDLSQILATPDEEGPASLLLTYDENGKVTAQRVQAYGGGKATAKVGVARLPLHDRAAQDATRRYLVKSDVYQVEDISSDRLWIKIRYPNPAKGDITGWINATEAGATAAP